MFELVNTIEADTFHLMTVRNLETKAVTKPRHKGGRSLTNKNTKHKQTRENTQQLNISLQIFITTTTLLINLHEYNN